MEEFTLFWGNQKQPEELLYLIVNLSSRQLSNPHESPKGKM